MKHIPVATYRLQFNREFTFRQAREILDYLAELGVTDVYASPLFEAGPRSTHGYDTCCFNRINPNLGTEDDFNQLSEELKKRNLGLLLDFVPNHMSATLSNPWWRDVLENGRDSPYADFFDIDWEPPRADLKNKVLLPVLEDHYSKVLESGKLRLIPGNMTDQEDTIHSHAGATSISPARNGGESRGLSRRSAAKADEEVLRAQGENPSVHGKSFAIAYYDRNIPVNAETLPPHATGRIQTILAEFNGKTGEPRSFDKLDALIQQQHYRLAFWKVAAEQINYRRFFDVTEMVALKMELPEVFRATHQLLFQWLNSGRVNGLRIDHPDGLRDPKEYLERIEKSGNSPYVVVEKILSGDEQLPENWPVDGTTGYDFLNRANGLFVDGSNAARFGQIYQEFTGARTNFRELAYSSKKLVLERSFASELNALTRRLQVIASRTRSGQNFTFSQLHAALEETLAGFEVYRTYITDKSNEISHQDRTAIQTAIRNARGRAGARGEAAVFDFIEHVLLLEMAEELDRGELKDAREFVVKFQQLSGPAMAKGLEDTAFYRFNRLVSLNEVGGDPGRFGLTVDAFHEANRITATDWPHSLLASATHDTKRGEDVRARLNVLSEMPNEWREAIARWSRLNRDKKAIIQNAPAPDANDEYLLYQTLIGASPHDAASPESWKSYRARVVEFMLKAVKEAKVNTSWTEPNNAYENALQTFIERALTENGNEDFLRDLRQIAARVAFFGRINSLAQTLLKIASPGVPDFYQGSELWDLNLVDPDNRRPVDFALRRKLLYDLKERHSLSELSRNDALGVSKLFLIWHALNFRKQRRELFDCGDYVPISAVGEKAEHVCVFARTWKGEAAVVVVPRLVFGLVNGAEVLPVGRQVWSTTTLRLPKLCANGVLRNVLTGERVELIDRGDGLVLEMGEALKNFPVALIEKR